MEDLIGQKLGQYEITALLGTGGMARVYRGRQESIKRDVAIKVIRADLTGIENFVKRFEHEAQTVASLTHPHILKVFDYGQQGTMAYLVMELLPGGNLADLIREAPLAPDVAARLLDQIASALDYAHQQGVIHRDLKPQNVLLDRNGNAYLTDFGIAKLLGESSMLTQPGTVMGTPSYMAPELWNGMPADSRTDIYALGIMLFEMLNGRVPFSSDTPFSLMNLHINQPVPSIREQRPDLPPAVEAVITKALSKQRETRFGSAGNLAAAFRVALSGKAPDTEAMLMKQVDPGLTSPIPAGGGGKTPPIPRPTPLGAEPPESKRRFPVAVVGILALLILVLGAAAVLVASNQNAPSATPSSVALLPTTPASSPTPSPMTTIDYYTADAATAMALKVQALTAEASRATPTPNPMTTVDYLTQSAATAMALKVQALTAEAALTRTTTQQAANKATLLATMQVPGLTMTRQAILQGPGLTMTQQAANKATLQATMQAPGLTMTLQAANKATLLATMQAGGSTAPPPTAVASAVSTERIAYVADQGGVNSLFIMDTNGQNARRLTSGNPVADPAWSPDGRELAYAVRLNGQWDIFAMPVDGGTARRLTVSNADERSPSWSPDGRQIVYTSSATAGRAPGLFVMNADGNGVRRLTDDVEVADSTWSPDGTRIAFAVKTNGQWDIAVIPASGGKTERLTVGSGNERFPAWSPDCGHIAYTATSPTGGPQSLWVMNADGREARQLTHDDNVVSPTWSPDGTRIAYTVRSAGQWDIAVMPLNGGSGQRLTLSNGDEFSPAWSAGARPASAIGSDVCLQNSPLRIGISTDFPALGVVRDNPNVVNGFGVELSNMLLDEAGVRHRFHGTSMSLLLVPLTKGSYDLVIGQVPINDQDAKTVNFSAPFFVVRQTLIIRHIDTVSIHALTDLRGKVIGVIQNSPGQQVAAALKNDLGGDLQVYFFNDGPAAVSALYNNKIDGVIADNLFALNFVKTNQDMNLATIDAPRVEGQLGIMVRKECPALLTLVNTRLAAVIQDGRYAKLYMDFFGVQPPPRFRP